MDGRSRSRMLRVTVACLAFTFAVMPGGPARAHVTKMHLIVGVATTAAPNTDYLPTFAIAAGEGTPSSGLALVYRDPVRIDCLSVTNVGPSGHKVSLNGQGDSGQTYYVTIDDASDLDNVAVSMDAGTGPCRANGTFGEYLSGLIVVAG